MSDPYTRIHNAHRPSTQIFTTKSLNLPKKVNSTSRIASALIRYNRKQLSYSQTAASERLTLENQPVLKISTFCGGPREVMERPRTTAYASRKLHTPKPVGPMSANCPSSPKSIPLVLTKYQPLQSRGQHLGERLKHPVISMRQKGDIDVKLEISTPFHESPGTKNMVLFIYEHILKDKTMYLNQLNSSKLFTGVTFKDIKHGSIILVANCVSLGDLSTLEDKYSSGELAEVLSRTILTRRLYSAVGYKGPGLQMVVSLEEADIEVCQKGLRSLTKSLKIHGLNGGTFVSRTDCIKAISHLLNKITSVQVTLNGDYNTFLYTLADFFTALKLTKPVQMTSFATLADVQWCHTYIKNSPSVGKELNTKPVHHFLQQVQYMHNEVECIDKEFKQWAPSFLKYLDEQHLEAFKHSVDHIKRLLHPDVKFADLDFSISMPMTVMERQLFADLVKYMPALQTAIYNMGDIMGVLKDQLSMNTTSKSTDNLSTPRTPVIKSQRPIVSNTSHEACVQKSADSDRFQTKAFKTYDYVENIQPKTILGHDNLRSKSAYAAIVPCGVTDNEDYSDEIETQQYLTTSAEDFNLRSPSLTSETMEQQLKVTIAYKPQTVPRTNHSGPTRSLLSMRKTPHPTEIKVWGKDKTGFTGRKTTTEMARKLELALSQKRKFEYESVSNITHLLHK